MNKRNIVIIMVILIVGIVIAGLYGTFAANSTVSGNDDTYAITLTGASDSISIPANDSKTVIYQVTNTNKGTVQYGIAYSGDNITVKVYSDSSDNEMGLIDYGETKFVKLYISNSGNTSSTAILKTVLGYEKGGSIEELVTDGYTLVTEKIGKLTTYIANLYDNAAKTTVTNNSIAYNYATSVSLMNDRLGNKNVGINDGNIRYYGANPNNYVDLGDVYEEETLIDNYQKNITFLSLVGIADRDACYTFFDCTTRYSNLGYEDESSCKTGLVNDFGINDVEEICGTTEIAAGTPILYRVIGLFKDVELADGSKQDLIKVIREDSVGDFAWDLVMDSSTGEPSSSDNNWHDSTLKTILNEAYYNSTSSSHSYFDLPSADAGVEKYTTVTADFSKLGPNSSLKDKMVSVVWNLGGHNSNSVYSDQMYGYERGEAKCSSCTYTTTWPGKVALAYPSDVGYAADFTKCSQTLGNYGSCIGSDWMTSITNGSGVEWLLSPDSGGSYGAWYVNSGYGDFSSSYVGFGLGVRPVFYLGSGLSIVSGNGSASTPYVIR